jgi:hypothetical protein
MQKGATEVAPFGPSNRWSINYGFFAPFVAPLALSAFMVESILCVVSIFMPVSVAAAGAGAGAIAGVDVSFAALSALAQAVIASTAATKARRFMSFS